MIPKKIINNSAKAYSFDREPVNADEVNQMRKATAILTLVENVRDKVGKTFIQKGVYLLQEGLGENLGYDYKLHRYGPYSEELDRDIDNLKNYGLIEVEQNQKGHGFRITTTDKGRSLLKENFSHYTVNDDKLRKISSLIGTEPVRKMELIGTVLYFSKKSKDVSEIKRLVNTVKPHFSDSEIEEAVRVLGEKGIIEK